MGMAVAVAKEVGTGVGLGAGVGVVVGVGVGLAWAVASIAAATVATRSGVGAAVGSTVGVGVAPPPQAARRGNTSTNTPQRDSFMGLYIRFHPSARKDYEHVQKDAEILLTRHLFCKRQGVYRNPKGAPPLILAST
jgi:hypothetical protein